MEYMDNFQALSRYAPDDIDTDVKRKGLHKPWLTESSGAFQQSHTMEECLYCLLMNQSKKVKIINC